MISPHADIGKIEITEPIDRMTLLNKLVTLMFVA